MGEAVALDVGDVRRAPALLVTSLGPVTVTPGLPVEKQLLLRRTGDGRARDWPLIVSAVESRVVAPGRRRADVRRTVCGRP